MSTTDRQIVQTGIVTEDFGSGITRVNHIDTYSCFELGETEHPGDGGAEYGQLASELNSGIFGDDAPGLSWDELTWAGIPESALDEWANRGPWGYSPDDAPDLWTVDYDHTGWLRELAEASVAVVNAEAVRPEGPILAMKLTDPVDVYSPREYNFSTDGYMATWTVDADALEEWLTDNGIVIENGRGIDGFIRTADDETWHLGRALEEYLERAIPDYLSDMYSYLCGNGIEDQYIDVQLTDAGRAWIEQYKRTH